MDDEIDRKIDVTAILFLLVRQQTHDLTLIGSGANGLGIQEWCYTKLDDEKTCWKKFTGRVFYMELFRNNRPINVQHFPPYSTNIYS